MSEKELTQKLLEVAHSAALWMLEHNQAVPPHAITLDKEGKISDPYFPHEHQEKVGWEDLLHGAADHIRQLVAQNAVAAVALGVELDNDGLRGGGIQVETAIETLFQIFPIGEKDDKPALGDPLDPDGLLFEDLFGRPDAKQGTP